MKIKVGSFTKEGFLSCFAFALEDGTILKIDTDWCWSGVERKNKEMTAFFNFMEEIQKLGVEVEGLEKLKSDSV